MAIEYVDENDGEDHGEEKFHEAVGAGGEERGVLTGDTGILKDLGTVNFPSAAVIIFCITYNDDVVCYSLAATPLSNCLYEY